MDYLKNRQDEGWPVHDEKDLYFYHPDHLGSSSWITDQDGEAVQHLQYLPFGEPYVDQRTTGWQARHTFLGKERDEETGYSYFGARYYDSDLSVWLSVDPLMHKYPGLSPYVYCANNPIRLIDPDGRKIDPASETEWNNQKQAITNRKASIDSEINGLTAKAERRGWSEDKLNRKTGDLKERSASLEKTLNTMGDLEKCQKTTYTLKQVGSNGNFYLGKEGADVGKMVIEYSSTATFVHEVTHGGQLHNGEVGISTDGSFTAHDLTDEVNAFKAQVSYDQTSFDGTAHNPSYITPDRVKNAVSKDGRTPYFHLRPGSINAP